MYRNFKKISFPVAYKLNPTKFLVNSANNINNPNIKKIIKKPVHVKISSEKINEDIANDEISSEKINEDIANLKPEIDKIPENDRDQEIPSDMKFTLGLSILCFSLLYYNNTNNKSNSNEIFRDTANAKEVYKIIYTTYLEVNHPELPIKETCEQAISGPNKFNNKTIAEGLDKVIECAIKPNQHSKDLQLINNVKNKLSLEITSKGRINYDDCKQWKLKINTKNETLMSKIKNKITFHDPYENIYEEYNNCLYTGVFKWEIYGKIPSDLKAYL